MEDESRHPEFPAYAQHFASTRRYGDLHQSLTTSSSRLLSRNHLLSVSTATVGFTLRILTRFISALLSLNVIFLVLDALTNGPDGDIFVNFGQFVNACVRDSVIPVLTNGKIPE